MSGSGEREVRRLVESFSRSDLEYMHVTTKTYEVVLSRDAHAVELDGTRTQRSQPETVSEAAAPSPAPVAEAREALAPAPDVQEAASGDSGNGAVESKEEELVVIESPSVGLFYRSPAPGEPPYTDSGKEVSAGATMGLIEAMKAYTAVHSSAAGSVVNVLVQDGDFVEFGQPLFEVRPSATGASAV